MPNAGQPNITCDPPDPALLSGQPSSYKVALNRDGMVAAYTDFCKQYADQILKFTPQPLNTYGPFGGPWVSGHQNIAIGAGKTQTYTPNGINNYCSGINTYFDEQACLLVFGALTDGCDTGTTTGKRGGSSNYACMDYFIHGTYSTADIFRLHIHQQMVDTFSQIE